MKSITEAIYDGWINERERRNKLPQDDPECIALSKFEDTLTKDTTTSIWHSRSGNRAVFRVSERRVNGTI